MPAIIHNVIMPIQAKKDYATRATLVSSGKEVDFNISKDSMYQAIKKDGHYQILAGPYLVELIPEDVFSESPDYPV